MSLSGLPQSDCPFALLLQNSLLLNQTGQQQIILRSYVRQLRRLGIRYTGETGWQTRFRFLHEDINVYVISVYGLLMCACIKYVGVYGLHLFILPAVWTDWTFFLDLFFSLLLIYFTFFFFFFFTCSLLVPSISLLFKAPVCKKELLTSSGALAEQPPALGGGSGGMEPIPAHPTLGDGDAHLDRSPICHRAIRDQGSHSHL